MSLLEQKRLNGTLGAIHFVGIGGRGLSGIATILHEQGYKVQGSDIAESDSTKRLEEQGIKVYIGHRAENVQDVSYVVVSTAINKDNLEIREALSRSIPVIKRAEMLAELLKFKCTVAVSGSHGKTTTTSLVACLFESAGLSPTVINGGIINSRSTNAYTGSGNYVIAEADESDATFIHLPSTIAVITNIDPEHLDFYGNFDNLIAAFRSFITDLPFYGFAVACIDHQVVRNVCNEISSRKIITYGIQSADAHVQAFNIVLDANSSTFDVKINFTHGAVDIERIMLPVPGQHNVLNALAAISVAVELSFDYEIIKDGFRSFEGVKQRFSKIAEYNGATIIEDFAHHPEEVKAAIATAKYIAEQQNGQVIAFCQPQKYARVQYLFDDFVKCFNQANQVYVTEIWAMGAAIIDGISSQLLVQQIQNNQPQVNASFVASVEEIPKIIMEKAAPGDVVIMMGAKDFFSNCILDSLQ